MTEQRLSKTAILVGGPLDGKKSWVRSDQTVFTATVVSHQYPPSGPDYVRYTSAGTTDDEGRVVYSFDRFGTTDDQGRVVFSSD